MEIRPKLYYNNSIYLAEDYTSDINPLLIERYKKKRFLAFAAREQQLTRLVNLSPILHKEREIILQPYGWWQLPLTPLLTKSVEINVGELYSWDVVVILDKDRVDIAFAPLIRAIDTLCLKS